MFCKFTFLKDIIIKDYFTLCNHIESYYYPYLSRLRRFKSEHPNKVSLYQMLYGQNKD